LLSGFKTDHVPDCTLLSHEYISALCFDAFNFIMVSTQTSTNISLLLLKEHTKTFSQTTLERSLMCFIDIHACETVQNGEAKSLHSCTEGTGSTQSHCSDRGRDKAIL